MPASSTPAFACAPAAARLPPPGIRRGTGIARSAAAVLPGLGLALVVTLAAIAAASAERHLLGRDWLEPLVLAIILGAALRLVWSPPPHWHAGLHFAARPVLELAVMLLGAGVSAGLLRGLGPALLPGIAAVVVLALGSGYAIGRVLGLPRRLALLIACGNAICGNSAIAAVAPVIGAAGAEITAAIGFTALLGVLVVLLLPGLAGLIGLGAGQSGVLAGLTVYAVPQVLAAAAPLGAHSVQIGMVVKLARVLMLGPVVVVVALVFGRREGTRLGLHRLVPWFILGFLALALLRSVGLLPSWMVDASAAASGPLTILAMAGLGLLTDLRVVGRAGPKVVLAAMASLGALGLISLGLIRLLGVA